MTEEKPPFKSKYFQVIHFNYTLEDIKEAIIDLERFLETFKFLLNRHLEENDKK